MSGVGELPRSDLDPRGRLVHEYLVSLGYRFGHVTEGAPEAFGAFEAGSGVRTPVDIVRHLSGMMAWILAQYEPRESERYELLPFEAECGRFMEFLREVDRRVCSGAEPVGEVSFDRLWRGPLADAMTHVGQLAMLRRLAGAPVERVRYWQVDMPDL